MNVIKDVSFKNINIGYNLELIITKNGKCDYVCLFLNGLNGDKNSIKYFVNLENCIAISFNHRQWEDNRQKSSKNPYVYIEDIKKIVYQIKLLYPNLKIFLLGESWGSALAIMFQDKYPKEINGIITWNMPCGIVNIGDDENRTNNIFIDSIKMIITFLFNIDFLSPTIFPSKLTDNKLLQRAINIRNKGKKGSNRVIIAAWKSFSKAWKILIKNLKNDSNSNFLYIQSFNDALISNKKVNIIEKNYQEKINKNIILLKNGGTHILSFDTKYSKLLFDTIKKYLSKW